MKEGFNLFKVLKLLIQRIRLGGTSIVHLPDYEYNSPYLPYWDHTYMTSAKRGRGYDEFKTILDVVEGRRGGFF